MNHPKQTLIEREHQHNLYDAPLLFTADILTGKVQVELVTTDGYGEPVSVLWYCTSSLTDLVYTDT